MAHFAEIVDGRVRFVTPIDDRHLLVPLDPQDPDSPLIESEKQGQAYVREVLGLPGVWLQTSYNGNPVGGEDRGGYAGPGHEWDENARKFLPPIPPQPFPQWVLNGRTWEPPTPQPSPAHEWDGPLGMWVDGTGRMDPATFALRFSATEQARIQASTDPEVQGIFEKLKSSPFVRPRSPVTVGAIDKLKAKGMLDHADRPAEILA